MSHRDRMRSLLRLAVLLIVSAILLFPLYWMITTSLTPTDQLFGPTPRWLPDPGQLGYYATLLNEVPMLRWLRNSAVVAVGTMVLSIVLGYYMAYALSRYKFRGRGIVAFLLFVTQMLPEVLLVAPLYLMFLTLGLLDNLSGLALVNAAFVLPVVVWVMKNAIDTVPYEIEESARVEGCDSLARANLIVVPLIRPALASACVIAFFYGWNEFLFASTFTNHIEGRTASVGLASFIGYLTTPLDAVMVGATVYALPALLFYLVAQKYVIRGLTAGGVKG